VDNQEIHRLRSILYNRDIPLWKSPPRPSPEAPLYKYNEFPTEAETPCMITCSVCAL
jgi:hypothetical protein